MSAPDIQYTPEQNEAIERLRDWADNHEQGLKLSLTGAAGTGKTTILAALKPFLEGKPVRWTAMTGKAALRMRELVGVQATTLHAAISDSPNQGTGGDRYFHRTR